jgi:WD40 repeat protein
MLRCWDAATGKERQRMRHDGHVRSAALSPDGRFAVSGGYDKSIRLWELETGKELLRQDIASGVGSVAYSPDGSFVAWGDVEGGVALWRLPLLPPK